MKVKKEKFWQRLETNHIDPVYLFFGQEEFLIREAIDRIKGVFFRPMERKSQYHHLYSDEVSIDRLIEIAMTLSFGKPKRLISYKMMGRPKPSDKDLISSYIERPAKDTVIVFTAQEWESGSDFFKTLEDKAVVVQFYPLFENQVPEWIRRQAQKIGVNVTSGAARLLMELVGTDLSLLVNELQKISIYLLPKKTIDVKDVEKTVGKGRIFSVFELIQSLGERNTDKSLRMVKQLMDAGQSPVGLIGLAGKHFRRLFKAKLFMDQGKQPSEIAKYIGVHPFFVKGYIEQARLFSLREIKAMFRVFLKTDLKLKSSPLSQALILDSLVFEICDPSVPFSFLDRQ